jgi:hypothetical protein
LCEDLENSNPLKTFLKYPKNKIKAFCVDGFRNIIFTLITTENEHEGKLERLHFDNVRRNEKYRQYENKSTILRMESGLSKQASIMVK